MYVCVGHVTDVVFSVCMVRRGGARVWEVFRHANVVYLCLVCILCVLHDLQLVNAGRG